MAEIAGNMMSADSIFVGRTRELALFQTAFDGMLQGHCRIVTLLGEPGIGKTRCAEAYGRAAEEQGALVLWGRCYEEPGAPPYWPWIQVLRDYIAASSQGELEFALDAGIEDIVALVPEIASRLQHARRAPANPRTEPSGARFRTFDAVGRFLVKAAQQVPLVVIIDNLHWADAPSLSLLEFLSHELSRARILVIGTYRDNEVVRGSALLETLGGLRRDACVDRFRLRGLDEEGIGALAGHMLGRPLPRQVLAAIFEQTDGNPLFVIELLKVLIEESRDAGVEPIAVRIPDGVREAIARRVARLSDACGEMLTAASVLGRRFGADEIAAVTGTPIDLVLVRLEEAVAAGLVEDTGGRHRFTHALIRETLYEEISTLDRLQLHARAGDALVNVHGARLEEYLTRIAHHYYESAALGMRDKAIKFAMRAADAAAAMQAYEEAVIHYDQVIGVLELESRDDEERLARTWFLKATALLWSGHTQAALQALLRAASYVHRAGHAEQLVDIATMLTLTSSCYPQQSHVGLLEKALTLLPDEDSAMRAKALGCLAFVKRSLGDAASTRLLVRDAVEMADRVGDIDTQCFTLKMAIIALRSEPDSLEQRIELGRRLLPLAQGSGRKEHSAEAHCWQALNLLEAGLIDDYANVLQSWDGLNIGPYALHRSFLDAGKIALALLGGEWGGVEKRIDAVYEAARKTRQSDAEGVYGAQMFALNRDLGRLRDVEPLVRRIAGSGEKAWTPGLMLTCSELGLLDDARRHFERIAADDFAALVHDDMYVTCLVFCAETCFRLWDAVRAAPLYQRLLPYAEQTANHPRAVCFGSTQLYLGMLARAMGNAAAARRHLAAAVERNRDMRAWPWLARAQFQYGALLAEVDEDSASSRQVLREAEALADRLGMASLLDEIGLLLRGGVSRYPDDLTEREVDVLRLVAIGRSNKDISLVLSISLNTVATHVRRILTKTHCANRTEAAAYAMRNDLHQPAVAAETTRAASKS